MKKLLSVEPFQDYWIDCINNNLLSVLLSHNPPITEKALLSPGNFYLKDFKAGYSQRKQFEETGKHLGLDFHSKLDILPWFVKESLPLTKNDIHKTIYEYLMKDYYSFVPVDRFYFPECFDFEKKHSEHRVFVYGMDVENEIYYILDDYRQQLFLEKYEISFADFERSILSKSYEYDSITCVKYREGSSEEFDQDDVNLLVSNLKTFLSENKVEPRESYNYHYGISCIERFANEYLIGYFTNLKDTELFQHHLYKIMEHHKKNILLIDYLHKKNVITDSDFTELTEIYSQLKNQWEVLKNSASILFQRMLSSVNNFDRFSNKFKKVQDKFNTLADLERKTTLRFIEVLTR